MPTTEAPSFDPSRVMQNPGHTVTPEGVDLTKILVDGQLVPVKKVLILDGRAALVVDPSKFDEIKPLGGGSII